MAVSRVPQTRPAAHLGRRTTVLVALLCSLLGVGGTAFAYWTTAGTGTGSATTGTLNPPTNVQATSTTGTSTVSVSWTATTGTTTPQGYYAVRKRTSDGATAAACGSNAVALVTTTSCIDTAVTDGTYTYAVVAVYRTWTATSAPSGSVTVKAAVATTTVVSSSVNPSVVGQSVTYTATVSSAGGTPTGSVTFSDGGQAITCAGGNQTLTNGLATCQVTYALAGSHVMSATYSGAIGFAASTSTTLTQVVGKAGQTVAFTTTAPTTATVGGTYAVAATASSGLTVTFTSATPTVCTSRGTNGATIGFVAVGTCTINANQAGDANYTAAPTLQQSFPIAKGNQTISFTTTAPAATVGGTYLAAATASSGLTVTLSSATPAVCTSSGTNGATIGFVAIGTCTINANQAGNANYDAALQAQQQFAVAKGSQSITFTTTAPTTASVGGATYAVAATATSGLTVSVSSITTGVCTISGSTVTFLAGGTCTISANQAGNANYNAAPAAQQTFSVMPAAPSSLTVTDIGSNKVTAAWTVVSGVAYQCQITAPGAAASAAWTTCTSGQQFTGQNGSHTFHLRAVQNGVTGPESVKDFSA